MFLYFLFKPGNGLNHQADITLTTVDFSCANSILNVRQKQSNGEEEMVYQTEKDIKNTTHGLVNLSSTVVSLSFHAPRRSCRINIQSRAVSTNGQYEFHFMYESCNICRVFRSKSLFLKHFEKIFCVFIADKAQNALQL